MRTVLRCPLSLTTQIRATLPRHALVLCVRVDDDGVPHLFVLADQDQPTETRVFYLCAERQAIPDGKVAWVDSFVLPGAVLHLFEAVEKRSNLVVVPGGKVTDGHTR